MEGWFDDVFADDVEEEEDDFDDGFDDDFSPSINLEKENVEASDAEGEDNLGELEDISLPEEDKNVQEYLFKLLQKEVD